MTLRQKKRKPEFKILVLVCNFARIYFIRNYLDPSVREYCVTRKWNTELSSFWIHTGGHLDIIAVRSSCKYVKRTFDGLRLKCWQLCLTKWAVLSNEIMYIALTWNTRLSKMHWNWDSFGGKTFVCSSFYILYVIYSNWKGRAICGMKQIFSQFMIMTLPDIILYINMFS